MIDVQVISQESIWLRWIPIIGNAITALGVAAIGLWRYYKLAEIDIEASRKRAERGPLPLP